MQSEGELLFGSLSLDYYHSRMSFVENNNNQLEAVAELWRRLQRPLLILLKSCFQVDGLHLLI